MVVFFCLFWAVWIVEAFVLKWLFVCGLWFVVCGLVFFVFNFFFVVEFGVSGEHFGSWMVGLALVN